MPSFAEIKNALAASSSWESISNLPGELEWLVGIPSSIDLGSFDTFLSVLHPIISTAGQLDTKHPDYWKDIENQIPNLRHFLRAHFTNPSLWESSASSPKILIKDYPYFLSLLAPTPPQAGHRLLPLKALLLIGDYTEYYNFYVAFLSDRSTFPPDDLINVANALRKCSDPDWKSFHLLLKHVPEWPGEGAERWRDAFLNTVINLPRSWRRKDYPGQYDFLFCLYDIASFVRPDTHAAKVHSTFDNSPDFLDPTEIPSADVWIASPASTLQFSSLTGREISRSPWGHVFRKTRSTTNEDTEAEGPEISFAFHQEGITSSEPIKAQAIEALEVRYTNYRTAMDNQRLPWTWDCLNPIEVRSLVRSLSDPTEGADNNNAQCKFLVWLILLTGQPLSEILNFALSDQSAAINVNGLIQGRFWQRKISTPPQAFTAKKQHAICLEKHTETVTFELPKRVANLAAAIGIPENNPVSRNHVRLGAALHLDSEMTEHRVRSYLEQLRGRDLRFLLGRLRKVLPKEIMCVTQNAVLTHLITASPTDAPPSGVYYSAFPIEHLQAAYEAAVQRIMGGV